MARVRAVFTLDGIAQRLRVIRLLQCALTFIIFVTSVYLAAYIGSHKLGLQGGLPVAAIMVPILSRRSIIKSTLY
jgi:hypothetical protein